MINPRAPGLTFDDWADRMTYAVELYGPVYKRTLNEPWQQWATYVINIPGVAALAPPKPESFSDWRDWADRLAQVLPA